MLCNIGSLSPVRSISVKMSSKNRTCWTSGVCRCSEHSSTTRSRWLILKKKTEILRNTEGTTRTQCVYIHTSCEHNYNLFSQLNEHVKPVQVAVQEFGGNAVKKVWSFILAEFIYPCTLHVSWIMHVNLREAACIHV